MNEVKIPNADQKTFVAPKPDLELGATDKLYLAVTRRSMGDLTFIYTLVSVRDKMGLYPMLPETQVATFKNSAQADIYHKTIIDIMCWQSKSHLQKIRRFFSDRAADFYKQSR